VKRKDKLELKMYVKSMIQKSGYSQSTLGIWLQYLLKNYNAVEDYGPATGGPEMPWPIHVSR